jgi:hypothetical protein
MMEPSPTPENRCEGVSLDIGIWSFLKAARLMRLGAALPSTRTWYSLTLVMFGEMRSGSCPTPTMFLGQSMASKPISVFIHLWWGASLGAGAAATTTQQRVLTTRWGRDVLGAPVQHMERLAMVVSARVRVRVVVDLL